MKPLSTTIAQGWILQQIAVSLELSQCQPHLLDPCKSDTEDVLLANRCFNTKTLATIGVTRIVSGRCVSGFAVVAVCRVCQENTTAIAMALRGAYSENIMERNVYTE